MLTLPAYTKINLSLEVTGRRDDGYHSIVSVLQMLDLHDTLSFEVAAELSLESDDPAMLAEGEGNLVLRAAHLLRETAGVKAGARITLEKRIPASAGLGGGSSDAAATLLGLSTLWGLDLPKPALAELGARLGSDLPFFFAGPTAFADERGERVVPLCAPQPFYAVLVCPQYNLPGKTKRLYAGLLPSDMSDGSFTRRLAQQLAEGADITTLPLCNTFERAAMQAFEGLAGVRRRMLEAGAHGVHLSGSGPTLFSLFPAAQIGQARKVYAALQAQGLRSFIAASVPGEGELP